MAAARMAQHSVGAKVEMASAAMMANEEPSAAAEEVDLMRLDGLLMQLVAALQLAGSAGRRARVCVHVCVHVSCARGLSSEPVY